MIPIFSTCGYHYSAPRGPGPMAPSGVGWRRAHALSGTRRTHTRRCRQRSARLRSRRGGSRASDRRRREVRATRSSSPTRENWSPVVERDVDPVVPDRVPVRGWNGLSSAPNRELDQRPIRVPSQLNVRRRRLSCEPPFVVPARERLVPGHRATPWRCQPVDAFPATIAPLVGDRPQHDLRGEDGESTASPISPRSLYAEAKGTL